MENKERIIDIEDGGFGSKQDTYDEIIRKQIQRCIDCLSMDESSCFLMTPTKEDPARRTKQKDRQELIINSVETLRKLLKPFTKNDPQKAIAQIYKDIKEYKKKIGERKIMVAGKGEVKIKDTAINPGRMEFKQLKNYKCLKYEDMFGHLVDAYHLGKAEIDKYSSE